MSKKDIPFSIVLIIATEFAISEATHTVLGWLIGTLIGALAGPLGCFIGGGIGISVQYFCFN